MRRPIVVSNLLCFMSVFLLYQKFMFLFYLLMIPALCFFLIKNQYVVVISVAAVLLSFTLTNKNMVQYDSLPENVEMKAHLYYGDSRDELVLKNNQFKVLVKNDINKSFKGALFEKKAYLVTYKKNDFFNRNPNTFDYKKNLLSNGYHDVVKLSQMEWIPMGTHFTFNLNYLNHKNKMYLIKKITGLIKDDETAGFIIALVFGDTSQIHDETLQVFRNNGTAHVLAISGLHIGLLYGMIYLSLFFLNKDSKGMIALMILFLYICFIGMKVSALRAGLMLIFSLLSQKYERKYDMINVVSLVSLMFIFFSPMHVFNIAYQLSFAAVLVISILYKAIKISLEINKSIFWKILLMPLLIQVGMMPLQVYYFNKISLLSFLINIPTIFIMTMVLYLSVLFMASFLILPMVSKGIAYLIHMLISLVKVINISYESFDWLKFEIPSPPVALVIVFYICLIMSLYKARKKIIISTCLVVAFSYFVIALFSVDVYFFDIGQGDSILITQKFKEKILIDGGPHSDYGYLKEILLKNGINRLDYVMVSHAHSDHIGGIIDISEVVKIDRLYYKPTHVPNDLFLDLLNKMDKKKFVATKAGDQLALGEWHFEIHGGVGGENLNNGSLVTTLKIFDTKLLFTGDIEGDAEAQLIKNNTLYDVDILKVPHHGSKTSSSYDFLKKIKPEVAIASLGRNFYGHPSEAVVSRYKHMGSEFYRTDKGCIKITILPFNYYFVKQYN